jgi:hypothetical protein
MTFYSIMMIFYSRYSVSPPIRGQLPPPKVVEGLQLLVPK